MNNINRRSLLMALIITLLFSFILIYSSTPKTKESPKNTENVELVKVFVANKDIKVNSIISKQDISEVSLPKKYVLSGYMANIEEIIGKTTRENIYNGEQIINKKINIGGAGDAFSSLLPKGYRAVTLSLDSVNAIAGNIKRGDFIDIELFKKPPYAESETVEIVFQSINIIDIKVTGDIYLVTLTMKPEDTIKLFLSQEIGKIKVTLRSGTDTESVNLSGVSAKIIK